MIQYYICICLTVNNNLIANTMNTRIINLNQYSILLSWGNDNKVYVSYHKEGNEIADWAQIDAYHQELIGVLVDRFCEYMNLNKWSY